jgi:hypothetical protein
MEGTKRQAGVDARADCNHIAHFGRTDQHKPGAGKAERILPLINLRQRIARAAPSAFVFDQNLAVKQIVDVARSRVLRCLRQRGPFGRRELLFEAAVEQAADNLTLPVVEGLAGVDFPKARLEKNRSEDRLGAGDRLIEAAEEPVQPRRDVEIAFLGRFEDVVVSVALLPDLGRRRNSSLCPFLA